MNYSVEKKNKSKTTQITKEAVETSKEIKRLVKLKEINEAIKLTEKYPKNVFIQSQRVNILIKKISKCICNPITNDNNSNKRRKTRRS